MNKLNFFKTIRENFINSKKNYDEKSKSDFWKKFYKKSNLANYQDKDLINFRKPKIFGSKISKGMNDDFGFFKDIETLINFLNIYKKEDLKEYSDFKVGNPKFYNLSDINFNHHEITTIKLMKDISVFIQDDHKFICEIGGGFGSLASKLKKKFPNLTIILIDLPESLILQTYYLMSLFPESKFFLFNDLEKNYNLLKDNHYDFIIIPPWEKDRLPLKKKIDFFINTHSFQEMDKSVIANYFEFIQTNIKQSGIFYNLNKYSKIINGENIKIAESPYDDNWEIVKNSQDWRNKNMHEIVVKRIAEKNYATKKIIKQLDKTNPSQKMNNSKLLSIIKFLARKILDIFMLCVPKKILLKILKIYL